MRKKLRKLQSNSHILIVSRPAKPLDNERKLKTSELSTRGSKEKTPRFRYEIVEGWSISCDT